MSEQLELFRTLEKDFNFELTPCDKNFDLDTIRPYKTGAYVGPKRAD